MEKTKERLALEEDLDAILLLVERGKCMIEEVMEDFFVFRWENRNGDEYVAARIKIEVAQEAIEKAHDALNKLLQ